MLPEYSQCPRFRCHPQGGGQELQFRPCVLHPAEVSRTRCADRRAAGNRHCRHSFREDEEPRRGKSPLGGGLRRKFAS